MTYSPRKYLVLGDFVLVRYRSFEDTNFLVLLRRYENYIDLLPRMGLEAVMFKIQAENMDSFRRFAARHEYEETESFSYLQCGEDSWHWDSIGVASEETVFFP